MKRAGRVLRRLFGVLGRQALPWAAAVLGLGLLVSFLAADATRGVEQRNAQQLLNRRAAAAAAAVTGELRRYQDTATQIAAALGAQQVTAAEFSAVTAPLTAAQLPGASGISFVAPATAATWTTSEHYWQARGAGRLTFTPVGAGSQHYFLVYARNLGTGPTTPLGSDVAGSPVLVRALDLARSSGATVVSDPHVLLRDRSLPASRQQLAFSMIAPVFARTAAGGRGAFVGWVTMGMRARNLAADTVRASTQDLVNVTLSQAGSGAVAARLHVGPAATPAVRQRVTIPVAQQHWVLTVQDTEAASNLDSGYAHLRQALALGGSAFSALLALLVWFLLTSRRRALERVARATAELRAAEADSRRQATLLEAVLNSISDGVAVLDSQGAFLVNNPASQRILDIPASPATADWQQRLRVTDVDGGPTSIEVLMGQVLGGHEFENAALVLHNDAHPDGLTLTVSAQALDPAGGVTGSVVAVFRDITEERRMQEELQTKHDSYERLLRVLSDLGEGVVILEGTRFVFVNDAFAALVGQPVAAVLAGPTGSILPDDSARSDFERARRQLDEAEAPTAVLTTRLLRSDGRAIPVEVTGMNVDAGGNLQRVLVIRDLSERERARAELAERAAALQTANVELAAARDVATAASRAKSAFLATMSHEIRTPLNAVIGLTDLLLDTAMDPVQRDYLATVHASGETLLSLINDILDWSKIESGALELEQRAFEVADCVAGAIDVLSAQAGGKDITMTVEQLPGCPDRVVGDLTRVRQILVNLIGNAVKFTEAGEVRVTAGPIPTGPGGLDGGGLRFVVSDTGIGIPPEKVQRLFRDFSQVDDSTTRTYGGTGLGLAISQRLAQAMGGTITVTSAPGVGSTFTVDLAVLPAPADSTRAEPAADDRVADAPEPSAARVLLVEDNLVNRTVAQLMLARLGYAADVAVNGREALDAARSTGYDIVLMDVSMPVMDGLEAARRLRAEPPPGPRPWIIALTANAMVEDRERCAAAGMDDYLSKPVRRAQLAAVLDRVPRAARA